MKKYALIGIAGLISFGSFAQKLKEKDVPTAVVAAFHKQFPEAKEVKWEKEKENYEASFDLKKVDNSVVFDESGKFIESEIEIKMSELPKGVVEYVQKTYSQKVKEAAKITAANGTVTYEAEIKGMDLHFDKDGKFLKEEKE